MIGPVTKLGREPEEIVRRLVLNTICDDYENVDQTILRDVSVDGGRFGFTIERSEVVDALAKAHSLSCNF